MSILVPMEVKGDKDKNRILLKDARKRAENQLEGHFDPSRINALLSELDDVLQGVDTIHVQPGLAIFLSDKTKKVLPLPVAPEELSVHVGRTFQTRHLLYTMQETPPYLFLSLSLEKIKLFQGMGDQLVEVENEWFPAHYKGPMRSEAVKHTLRTDVEREELEDVRIFLRTLDGHLNDMVKDLKPPIVVAGEGEWISFLKEQNKSARFFVVELQETLTYKNAQELGKRIMPHLKQYYEGEKLRMKEKLQESIGADKYTCSLQDVWRDTKLGKIDTLFVERGYHMSAREGTTDELQIEIGAESGGRLAKYHEDVVDDIIEMVTLQGGKVIFMEDGGLQQHHTIAAITRYQES